MRIAAVILNVLLLVAVGFLLADKGLPSPDEDYFFLFLLMVVTPVFTIVALFQSKSESWLALYFKRKAVEERKRIEEIEGQAHSQQPPERDK